MGSAEEVTSSVNERAVKTPVDVEAFVVPCAYEWFLVEDSCCITSFSDETGTSEEGDVVVSSVGDLPVTSCASECVCGISGEHSVSVSSSCV